MKNRPLINLLLGAFCFGLFSTPLSERKAIQNMKERYEKEINNSFDYLKNIDYLNDRKRYVPLNDYWQTPEETSRLKTGDCEDKSIYFMDLLNKKGIQTQLAFGFLGDTSDEHKHIWLEYPIGNKRYVIECSMGGVIYNRDTLPTKNGYRFIKVSGEMQKEYLEGKIKNFEKKSNIKLNFKNLEDKFIK